MINFLKNLLNRILLEIRYRRKKNSDESDPYIYK